MKLCPRCDGPVDQASWYCAACRTAPGRDDRGLLDLAPALAPGEAGYDPAIYQRMADLEARHFWFRSRIELIVWAIASHFPGAASVLEIGCGSGLVLSALSRANPRLAISGGEALSEGLALAARRNPALTLYRMDARRLPFTEAFDVVGAFDVLEHIAEDGQVLAQMHRATKTGGGIAITVPQHPSLWSQADVYAHHVRRYQADDLVAKVERAGFRIRRVTSFVTALLPLMAATRYLRDRRGWPYDPMQELAIAAWPNRLFHLLMSAERSLIRRGVSFPFGGSLLVVAAKE